MTVKAAFSFLSRQSFLERERPFAAAFLADKEPVDPDTVCATAHTVGPQGRQETFSRCPPTHRDSDEPNADLQVAIRIRARGANVRN